MNVFMFVGPILVVLTLLRLLALVAQIKSNAPPYPREWVMHWRRRLAQVGSSLLISLPVLVLKAVVFDLPASFRHEWQQVALATLVDLLSLIAFFGLFRWSRQVAKDITKQTLIQGDDGTSS